jgi:lipoprotein-releasing system permease protein
MIRIKSKDQILDLFNFFCSIQNSFVNYELFIARKLIASRNSLNKGTRVILNISILGICLGLAVMIIALSTLTGFQREIQNKVVGFGSHVQITEFNFENPLNFKPIDKNQTFYPSLNELKEVRNIQVFALKEGIIKTKEDIHGVITKGIDSDFDWSFFNQNLIEGQSMEIDDSTKTNQAIVSKIIAQKMNLKVGDDFLVYFIKNGKTRPRKFIVQGVYHTGLEQFDKAYILIDIKHIQRINEWNSNEISGFEVILGDYKNLFHMNDFLYKHIPPELNTTAITQQYPEIFGWLSLQDMNVIVIVFLMSLVCGINMISALLILVLEKTNFIGIMKALGATSTGVRKTLIYMSMYLIGVGLFWGNVLGVGLLLLQEKYHFLKLDQSSYYISYVPVNINFGHLFLLNSITLVVCLLFMLIPSMIVTNISPVKAIRFD